MWQEHRREGNRDHGWNKDEGRRPDGNRISVAKHATGKVGPFMLFLNREGRKSFWELTGQRFDNNNARHRATMSEIYIPLKEAYIVEAKRYNETNKDLILVCDPRLTSLTKKLQKNKHQKDKQMRQQRHSNPSGFRDLRLEHMRNLKESRVPTVTEIPLKDISINTLKDQEAFMSLNKEKSARCLKAMFAASNATNGSLLIGPGYNLQVISVFPMFMAYKYRINKMCCYPAEIAITTFHLLTGVVDTSSIFVSLDGPWLNGNDQVVEGSGHNHGAVLGIGEFGPVGDNVLDPCEAFRWVQSELEKVPAKRLLCDAEQVNFVFYGLKMLAEYTGINASRYFQHSIAPNLTSIQDYTSNLLTYASIGIARNEKWTDEEIKEQFRYHMLVPSVVHNHICEFHEETRSPTKYYCVKAHNARLLHNFYYILKKNRLEGFFENFSESIHCPCIVDDCDPNLPPTYRVATIEKEFVKRQEGVGYENYDDSAFNGALYDCDSEDDEDEFTLTAYNSGYQAGPSSSQRNPPLDVFVSNSQYAPSFPGRTARDIDPEESVPVPRPTTPQVPQVIATMEDGTYRTFAELPEASEWVTPVIQHIYTRKDSKHFTSIQKESRRYNALNITCL